MMTKAVSLIRTKKQPRTWQNGGVGQQACSRAYDLSKTSSNSGRGSRKTPASPMEAEVRRPQTDKQQLSGFVFRLRRRNPCGMLSWLLFLSGLSLAMGWDITKTWIEKEESCFHLVGYRKGNGERRTYGTLKYGGGRGGNEFLISYIETKHFDLDYKRCSMNPTKGKDRADQVRQILIVSYLTFMLAKHGRVSQIDVNCDQQQECEYIKSPDHRWGRTWKVDDTIINGPMLTCNDWVTRQYLDFMQKSMGFKPTFDTIGPSRVHMLTMKSDEIKKLQDQFSLCDDGFGGVYIVDTSSWNEWKFQSKIKRGEIIDWAAGLDCSVGRIKNITRGTHDHARDIKGNFSLGFRRDDFHCIACQIPPTKHKRQENINEGDAVYNTRTQKFGTVSEVTNGCGRRKIFIKWTDGKSQRWHKHCISGRYIEECHELFTNSTNEKYVARHTEFMEELGLRRQELRSLGADDRDYIKPPTVWREIQRRQYNEQ